MSHNAIHDKSVSNAAVASCGDVLTQLYQNVDPTLFLELRAIDPTGARQPKQLWTPVGSPAAKLKQLQSLNKQGYGAYFAPCPRREAHGSADYAAVLPALWVDIDCENDPTIREQALARLKAFEPPVSMIIDSGGGWHAYWLLSESYLLISEADRQYATNLLKGLFAALKGDPEYVKSVASVMRLPGLINTKPNRNGAVVTVTYFEPDRRYPLNAFEWLVVNSTGNSTTTKDTLSFFDTGHAPLPPATLDYLKQGAVEGERNKTLFAAACQMRDAGYSQAEAEGPLVARYVADGNGAAGRDREAQATVASVYRKSPRDPLTQQKQSENQSVSAREQVDALVTRYATPEAQTDHPTAEQIADTVRACANLDPIAWAAERKRIKALCGDDFRLTDLDRMYKRAQKDAQKASFSTGTPTADCYFIEDGCILYERHTERGKSRQVVASWSGRILEWVTGVADEGQTEHIMRLELTHTGRSITLDVPSELFGDANALSRFIAGRAGGLYTVRASMGKHLVPALLSLSGEPPQRTIYCFIGWTKVNGQWTYVAPNMSVTASGALEQSPTVELEPRLRDYALSTANWTDSLQAFSSTIAVLPKDLAPGLIAFALLPIVQQFFPAAAPRPAMHLVGTTNSGKSEIAALLTNFYGRFSRDTPPAQWGDTVNMVEVTGFPLADALYWVDDYKSCYADERNFTRFLQSYSRGMGRGRLTREAKMRQERPCRGLLLSTGETTIEGEASVIARMLVLEISPWEKRDPGGKLLAKAAAHRDNLASFTAHFATWVAAQADAGTLSKHLANSFDANVRYYRDKLHNAGGNQASTGRMVQNWAVLFSVYQLLREFLGQYEEELALPVWQDVIAQTVQAVQHERAGESFLNTLAQLLASGEAVLANDTRHPDASRPNAPIIGYQCEDHILLLPEVAYREVSRIQPLKFSASAIGAQLKEDGWLLPGPNSLTVQRRVCGIATRVWQLKNDFLTGSDGGET